jgi:hypothetical protein
LNIQTVDNTNSFGFWESPLIGLEGQNDRQAILPTGLYRTVFTVANDLADPTLAPVMRVRTSSENYERGDVVTGTSVGAAEYSPSSAAEQLYIQYFMLPETQTRFRMTFDVLNADPTDAANVITELRQVEVEAVLAPDTEDATLLASFNFDTENDSKGWTPRFDQTGNIEAPETFAVPETGLLIRGSNLPEGRQAPYYPEVIFGYWGVETTTPTLTGGKFYLLRWYVTSEADQYTMASTPVFRLRVNSRDLEFSSVVNIDSVNDTARVPVDGTTEMYEHWFEAPPEVDGEGWIFSFDYLYVNKEAAGSIDLDDPTIGIILEALEVYEFDAPPVAPAR